MSPVPESLLAGLNTDQSQAVSCLAGPLQVVAGPGSGKTRVLTHRIAALLASGVPARSILAVTFTNKAAAELRARLRDLVGPQCDGLWVLTFHAACLRILRAHPRDAGLPPGFSVADAADAHRLLGSALAAAGAAHDAAAVRRAASEISRAKNAGLDADQLAADPARRHLAAPMRAYAEQMAAAGLVDFDDLLTLTHRLLATRHDLRDRYRARFAHVSVDEWQDTNALQYAIVRLLCPGRAPGSLCVVGDADQSIYAFRGATPSVMDRFTADHPGARVVVLDANYRSTGQILAVVRAVIAANPATHRPALDCATGAAGSPVRLVTCADDRDEAAWVADQVVASLRAGASACDHAVLVRTNAATRAVEEALARRAVAYDVVAGLRFYDRAEVKDVLAWLRTAANPADPIALARAAGSLKRGVGASTLARVVDDARDHGGPLDLHASVRRGAAGALGARFTGPLGWLDSAVRRVQDAARVGPAAAVAAVLDDVGLRATIAAADPERAADRVANLEELAASAAQFLTGPAPTLPGVDVVGDLPGWQQTLAWLEATSLVTGDTAAVADAVATGVQVMTAHAAKGREFDHVWVIGVEDGMYPHTRSSTAADVAEERRLLFVACSRARRTLTLTHCQQRMLHGSVTVPDRSPFLDVVVPVTVAVRTPALAPVDGPPQQVLARTRATHEQLRGPRPARPSAPGTQPAQAAARLDADTALPGTWVLHPRHGSGRVLAQQGLDTVKVQFADRSRLLDLRHAPLQLDPDTRSRPSPPVAT